MAPPGRVRAEGPSGLVSSVKSRPGRGGHPVAHRRLRGGDDVRTSSEVRCSPWAWDSHCWHWIDAAHQANSAVGAHDGVLLDGRRTRRYSYSPPGQQLLELVGWIGRYSVILLPHRFAKRELALTTGRDVRSSTRHLRAYLIAVGRCGCTVAAANLSTRPRRGGHTYRETANILYLKCVLGADCRSLQGYLANGRPTGRGCRRTCCRRTRARIARSIAPRRRSGVFSAVRHGRSPAGGRHASPPCRWRCRGGQYVLAGQLRRWHT